MSGSPFRTVTRRCPDGWLAIRMSGESEVARATGATYDKAREKLILKLLPESCKSEFQKIIVSYHK
jgi:hypothetical protein